MFEVARSRRMCCSRACSVSTYAVLPSLSTDLADETSRNAAHVLFGRSDETDVRTAVRQRHAEALRFADDDFRAPRSPASQARRARSLPRRPRSAPSRCLGPRRVLRGSAFRCCRRSSAICTQSPRTAFVATASRSAAMSVVPPALSGTSSISTSRPSQYVFSTAR